MTLQQVKEFNTTFGVPMSETPTSRVPAAGLRYELIREEFEELEEAMEALDIVEVADALGDIEYVVHGAILVFGLENLKPNWNPEIHSPSVLNRTNRESLLFELQNFILWNNTQGIYNTLDKILTAVNDLARSFEIDLPAVVDAIHKSNMSKLGEDGKPIYRESDRKVMKGPKYQTPTEDIRKLMFGDNYAPVLG